MTIWRYLLVLIVIPELVWAQMPPAKVVVMPIFEKEVARTTAIVGVVDFDRVSGISSEISGLIETQNMREGQVVNAGDILASLNQDFIAKDVEILKTRRRQIDIRIQNTLKNLKRYETLFKQDAASEKAYDDLVNAHRELVTEREVVTKQIEKSMLELKKTQIHAPFKGLILERFRNKGEWISPGVAICSLASIDEVVVKVAVPEELVRFVHSGENVALKITALNRSHTGTIKTIVPVADLASKTFQIKIAIPWSQGLIRNMSATVDIPSSERMPLKMIKRDALVMFQGKYMIYTVKDGKAAVLPVNIAAYVGEYIGADNAYLHPGMPVVVEGNDRLRPDQPVQVIRELKPNG